MIRFRHRGGQRRPVPAENGARAMTRSFMGVVLTAAAAAAVCLISPAFADDGFSFRLSPGPRLVGTRAESSGSGEVKASLTGSTLVLDGHYHGLLGVPTMARLLMGSAPGVRGPKLADLAVAQATEGAVTGKVKLNAKQLATFHKGGLYIEIDSADAPDGDLWGWVMPPAQ